MATVAMTLIFIMFSGCAGSSEEKQSISVNDEMYEMTEDAREEPSSGTAEYDKSEAEDRGADGQKDLSTPSVPEQPAEKIPSKIIKTADISYQVEKFNKSRKEILSIVNRFNAYVSSEDQNNDGYRLNNTLVIRTDSKVFDTLVEALMKEAIYVEYKRITAQDVTEEFVDVTARLKSKKEVEAQYLEILKKARSIDEILDVQQYLRQIREEIESFEGRLKYLNDRVAYSTITLKFYENLDVISRQPDRTFGSKIAEAFEWGWGGLKTFFLGIIYLWPLWIVLGITAWLLVFFLKRGRKRRKAKKSA